MCAELGVCWYPEKPSRSTWTDDVRQMHAMGIEFVRLGPFPWTTLAPRPDTYDWSILDDTIALLAAHGLRATVATPASEPPRWFVRDHPDAVIERRRLCPSHPAGRSLRTAILQTMAARYGPHPAVAGFEISTTPVHCECPTCTTAFRDWLAARYGDMGALDDAWGTDYVDFENIVISDATHPSLRLDHWRFVRDQTASDHSLQAEILRTAAPHQTLTHTDAWPYLDLAGDLAASRPRPLTVLHEEPWTRTGHPDAAAFVHDLYRRAGGMQVSELQVGALDRGPVPAPGMIRLWAWEAIAHGARRVSFGRWRQATHGHEQDDGAMICADGRPAEGHSEAWRVARELAFVTVGDVHPARVALLVDREASTIFEIRQSPASYEALTLGFYEALRRLGLDVDVRLPGDDLSSYALTVAPSLPVWRGLNGATTLVVGPRTASQTVTLGVAIDAVGDGRARCRVVQGTANLQCKVRWNGKAYDVSLWRDRIATDLLPAARFDDGEGAVYEADGLHWIAFWPPVDFLIDYLETLCEKHGIATLRLAPQLRLRSRGNLRFAFNYGEEAVDLPAPSGASFLLGSRDIAGRSVTAWRTGSAT